MKVRQVGRSVIPLYVVIVAGVTVLPRFARAGAFSPPPVAAQNSAADEDWSSAHLVQPDALADKVKKAGGPLVICVGFDVLYQSAHIPGSLLYGPGREASGLKALEDAARTWRRDRDIVLYCGCCPMKQCPNVRPAFRTLQKMGFTHVRVVNLERDFRDSWMQKGFPVEKEPPK